MAVPPLRKIFLMNNKFLMNGLCDYNRICGASAYFGWDLPGKSIRSKAA
jgi:hypothetical protein